MATRTCTICDNPIPDTAKVADVTMTSTNPYADAYDAYWAAGWRGVLPLPYRKKTHPPTGYTGRNAAEPSYADCAAWADGAAANIALHLPPSVVGIDVDDYAGKGGGDTLQRLVDECGSLPPTWMSTSRGDGISGIRLYRIPAGVELVSALTGGIEIIQAHHRYVVCWPSVHPEGRTYEWVNEATGAAEIPPVESLPYLPAAWIDRLTAANTAHHKADVDGDDIREFLEALPDGDPCQHIQRAAGIALSGSSRHDAYNHATLAVLSRGRQGCPGARAALTRMQKAFIAEIAAPGERATVGEATAEWWRNVLGAIAIVLAEHPQQGAACIDDYMAELALNEEPREGTADATGATQDDEHATGVQDGTNPPSDAYERAVRMEASKLKLRDDAKQMLARYKAGQAPAIDGIDLGTFLSQPDEVIAYRVDRLWPSNGRVLLAAAAKAGKTTMMTNLLACLADGGQFLGVYNVDPIAEGRTVVYINLEVGAAQMRRWLRRTGVANVDRVHVVNLRGQASALTLASDDGRKRIAEYLQRHNADMVILDPLAPLLASLGLDENSNTDVATFFSWWAEMLHLADVVDDLVCHHAGHNGGRSRGASRLMDEPDALWTITRDKAVDEDEDDVYGGNEPRFFKATGRDVEEPEAPIIFDGVTGLVTLGDGDRKTMRSAAKHKAAETRVLKALEDAGHKGLTRRDIEGLGGSKGENYAAAERLIESGDVVKDELNPRHHCYLLDPSRGVPSVPGDTRGHRGHVVSPPYIGGHTSHVPPTPPQNRCRSCDRGLDKPGLVYCPECAQRRLEGEDL